MSVVAKRELVEKLLALDLEITEKRTGDKRDFDAIHDINELTIQKLSYAEQLVTHTKEMIMESFDLSEPILKDKISSTLDHIILSKKAEALVDAADYMLTHHISYMDKLDKLNEGKTDGK